MRINVQKLNWKQARTDAIAFFQIEDTKWISQMQNHYGKGTSLYNASNTLLQSGDMLGKNTELFVLYPTKTEAKASRIILAGVGKREHLNLEQVRRAAARIAKKALSLKARSVSLYLPTIKINSGAEVAQAVVEGFVLGMYKFDKFFKLDEPRIELENLTILSDDNDINGSSLNDVKRAADQAQIIANATNFARDMSNEPSNNKYPEVMGNWAKRVGRETGIKVTVMGPSDLAKNKMIGTLTVNKGSEREARFIVMEYRGSKKKNDQPYVLVGKGITFDTGGISIKPAAGMGEMKSDMSGAAAVIATMKAVGDLKLPVNVIGLVASAENMPSGTAMRPGDIITYPNGLSVEIDNTDAEGRLVLADGLLWADKFKPKSVIDLATLTGACVVALGHVTTGMMGTDESMKARLKRAGDTTHERVCELPIYEEYEELIKSDVADIKNVGGRWAGAITAALFLKRFTNYPWIHLDIAGPARADANGDYIARGGTGVGVRLLTKMLMDDAKA